MTQVTYCNNTRRYTFDHTIDLDGDCTDTARVRTMLSDLLTISRFDDKDKMNLCLCLEEAVQNAFDHGRNTGCMKVEVRLTVKTDLCIMQVVDFGGLSFNPEYFEKLARRKPFGYGGRGIFLIKNLMDEVYYFFHPGRSTSVVMIKYGGNLKRKSGDCPGKI